MRRAEQVSLTESGIDPVVLQVVGKTRIDDG